MKIAIITGSRDWTDIQAITKALEEFKPDKVVQGRAKGADTIARDWAITNGVEYEDWPARWDLHGKAAGAMRNERMLERYAECAGQAADVRVFAFRLGGSASRGTTHAINTARGMNLITNVTDRPSADRPLLPGFTTGEE